MTRSVSALIPWSLHRRIARKYPTTQAGVLTSFMGREEKGQSVAGQAPRLRTILVNHSSFCPVAP